MRQTGLRAEGRSCPQAGDGRRETEDDPRESLSQKTPAI